MNQNFLVLDGPTGTQLVARGFVPDPVYWTARAAIDRPDLLSTVHFEYLRAGANIITANTFKTSSFAVSDSGLARKLTQSSVALATEAIETFQAECETDSSIQLQSPIFLAGSIGPLADCYTPRLVPELAVLEKVHAETASWLLDAGCDLLLIETMGTAREALVAVRAARKAGAKNVAVSFITDTTGKKLLGGDSLSRTARDCVESGADVILVNCMHADVIELALPELKEVHENGVVIGAYANASHMTLEPYSGAIHWQEDIRPEIDKAHEYATIARDWLRKYDVRILGSCCGSSPAHTRELAELLKK